MGIRRNLLRLLALLFAFAMVAAACGSSDDADSSSGGESETTAAHSDDGGDEEEEEDTSIGGGLSQDAAEAIEGDDEEEEVDEDAPTFDRSTLDGIWEEAAYNRQKWLTKSQPKWMPVNGVLVTTGFSEDQLDSKST